MIYACSVKSILSILSVFSEHWGNIENILNLLRKSYTSYLSLSGNWILNSIIVFCLIVRLFGLHHTVHSQLTLSSSETIGFNHLVQKTHDL